MYHMLQPGAQGRICMGKVTGLRGAQPEARTKGGVGGRARNPTRPRLVESTNSTHGVKGRHRKFTVVQACVIPVARGNPAAPGGSLVVGRVVVSGGATQFGGENLMVGQLPLEQSGPAHNSSPAALQPPAELALATPAETQGQYVPAWRSIETCVHSGYIKEEGISANDCEN